MADGGEAMAMTGGRSNVCTSAFELWRETAMGSSSLYDWHTEHPYVLSTELSNTEDTVFPFGNNV